MQVKDAGPDIVPISPRSPDRIQGTRVASNVVFNLAGQVAPAIAAVFAVPVLLQLLGKDRFALLALAWTIVGYFSVFDFGFGRALTRELAACRDRDPHWQGSLMWTALLMLGGIGLVLAVLLAGFTPILVDRVLNVPFSLAREAKAAFLLLALALPTVTLGNALRGILEAEHAFRALSAIRIPTAMGMVLGPMLVAMVTPDLVWIVASIVFFRLISFACHLIVAIRKLPLLRRRHSVAGECVRVLTTTGGWITVSNVLSPLMVTGDRFLLGSMVSLTAVAYYSTAFEVATKLWLISGAVTGVLFPAFAETLAEQSARATRLLSQALGAIFLLVFPVAAVVALFSHELLTLWVGSEIASNSSKLLAWMTCAVLLNCLGQLFFAYLQAGGRAAQTALFHIVELPLYVLLFMALVPRFGVFAAALAWAIRIALDTMLLGGAAWRLQSNGFPGRSFLFAGALTVCLLAASLLHSIAARAGAFAVLNLAVISYFYFSQHAFLRAFLSRLRRPREQAA